MRLTENQKKVLACMDDLMGNNYRTLEYQTGIIKKELQKIIKFLKEKHLISTEFLVSEDDGMLPGMGFIITGEGTILQNKLNL